MCLLLVYYVFLDVPLTVDFTKMCSCCLGKKDCFCEVEKCEFFT